MSSRLFAICYFTVSYKWWVVALLMFHSCVVLIATFIQNRDKVDCDNYYNFSTIFFMGIHSLTYDYVELSVAVEVIGITMSVYFSHILFELANLFIILMFYFSYHPNAWYSLPVTVCVCVFSVLGSAMRISSLLWPRKKTTSGLPASSSGVVNTC